MAVLRFSSLFFLAMLALAVPAAAQEAAEWERSSASKIDYANMVTGKGELFGFYCRELKNKFVGGLVMKMPMFTTMVRDEQTYSLNIVIDGNRDSVTLKAKDIELWFEAVDLSQQLTLARLYESVKSSHRLQMGIASIGWRGSYDYDNAAEKLDGLMDKCL